MPSTLLRDSVRVLADKYLEVRETYEEANPGKRLQITCTYRSAEEQWQLYRQGRKLLANGTWVKDDDPRTSIVTQLDGKEKKSKHNSNPAAALDVVVVIAGKASWRIEDYVPFGELAQAAGLVWGGTWGAPASTVWERLKAGKFVDAPHVELA